MGILGGKWKERKKLNRMFYDLKSSPAQILMVQEVEQDLFAHLKTPQGENTDDDITDDDLKEGARAEKRARSRSRSNRRSPARSSGRKPDSAVAEASLRTRTLSSRRSPWRSSEPKPHAAVAEAPVSLIGCISAAYIYVGSGADIKQVAADLRNHGPTVIMMTCASE